MELKTSDRIGRCLCAGALALALNAAHAAPGYNIAQSDESKIAIGMTAAEVSDRLGPPAQIVKYANQPGPTWTYDVLAAPFGITKFDIDFGSDGRVASASERIIGSIW